MHSFEVFKSKVASRLPPSLSMKSGEVRKLLRGAWGRGDDPRTAAKAISLHATKRHKGEL